MGFKQLIVEASALEIWNQYFRPKFLDMLVKAGSTLSDFEKNEVLDNLLDTITEMDITSKGSPASAAPGKYFRRICEWLIKIGPANSDPSTTAPFRYGFTYSLANNLTKYDEALKFLPPEYRSINAFKTYEDFMNFAGSKLAPYVQQAREKAARKGIKVIYEDERWFIISPKTHIAAVFFGEGSGWCTSRETDTNYYNQYSSAGEIIMVLDKEYKRNSLQTFVLLDDNKKSHHIDYWLMNFEDTVTDPENVPEVVWKYIRETYPERYDEMMDKINDDWSKEDDGEDEGNDISYWSETMSDASMETEGAPVPGMSVDLNCAFELTAGAYMYKNDGDDLDTVDSEQESIDLDIAFILPGDLDETVHVAPEVNFKGLGVYIQCDEEFLEWEDDTTREQERILLNRWEDEGAYAGDGDANELSGNLRYYLGRAIVELPDDTIALMKKTAEEGGIYFAWDSSSSSDMDDENDYLGRALNSALSVRDPDCSDSTEATINIAGEPKTVRIYYDDTYGSLDDALADSDFVRRIQRYVNPEATRQAGQREFEFSSTMTAPTEVPGEGIRKPVANIKPIHPQQVVRTTKKKKGS
jgi:hypothetical protein